MIAVLLVAPIRTTSLAHTRPTSRHFAHMTAIPQSKNKSTLLSYTSEPISAICTEETASISLDINKAFV